MNRPPIRILIIDDHPAMRAGINALVSSQSDMEVVAEGGCGREAIQLHRELQPDIVLMDLRLPDLSGVEAILAIRAEFPDARVIVVTTYDSDEDIYRAVQSGAKSYLLKDRPKEEFFATIRGVHAGETILPSEVAERLSERMRRPDLSDREMEVLLLISKGHGNKSVATQLRITEDTVKFRLKALFWKLGVHDRTAAVVTAVKLGIVQLE